MILKRLVAVLVLVSTGLAAQPADREIYAPFAELLERHVVVRQNDRGGRIAAFDYRGALDDSGTRQLLREQNRRLAAFDPVDLDQRAEALAFWINAYNYLMIAHILGHAMDTGELVDGVKDFGGLLSPFRVFRQDHFRIGSERYSLDEIEKEILLGSEYRERGWMDARIHFAVNCASVSCPPLRPAPYRAEAIDEQLDDNTRRALATDLHLRIDGDTARVSSLFDWYADDYRVGYDSVRAFIAAHLPEATARALERAERIEYLDYDWSLNRPANFPELAMR